MCMCVAKNIYIKIEVIEIIDVLSSFYVSECFSISIFILQITIKDTEKAMLDRSISSNTAKYRD